MENAEDNIKNSNNNINNLTNEKHGNYNNNQYLESGEINADINNDIIINMSEMDKESGNGIEIVEQDNVVNTQYDKNIVIITQEDIKDYTNFPNIEVNKVVNTDNKTKSIVPINNSNEILLFFFINPLSGSGSGINVINMEIKKIEFSDNLGCTGNPNCTAYIYNLNDPIHLQTGIDNLKKELIRGIF